MKIPFTTEQHEAIGKSLKKTRRNLMDLHEEISRRYGKTHKAARAAGRALKYVGELRNQLDNTLGFCTSEGVPDTQRLNAIYYGGPDEFPPPWESE